MTSSVRKVECVTPNVCDAHMRAQRVYESVRVIDGWVCVQSNATLLHVADAGRTTHQRCSRKTPTRLIII